MNKSIQAIKKLKNHFSKLSKKNKSGSTDALLPIIRNADATSETRAADTSTLLNGQKSPQEKTDQSSQPLTSQSQSQSLLMNTEDIKTMKAELPEMTETEKLNDVAIEQQLASLNQRLKILVDENERTKKREKQLFAIKNEILAKIDLVKKQIDEAMDHYRDIAHACHEKIEKEEILQNEMLLDLKERVDKLNDVCADINNQVDDMTATLNAYNIGKSDLLNMVTAYSIDAIMHFFQCIYATIISITKKLDNGAIAATRSSSIASADLLILLSSHHFFTCGFGCFRVVPRLNLQSYFRFLYCGFTCTNPTLAATSTDAA